MACTVCLNLRPPQLKDINSTARAVYFINLNRLSQSAKYCTECKLLVDALACFNYDIASSSLETSQLEMRVAVDKALQLFLRQETLYLELFRDTLQNVSPIPDTIGLSTVVAERSDSGACIEMLRSWLLDCETNHDLCRGRNDVSPLPTRILKICPEGSGQIRLEQSSELSGKYVALSYVWGKRELHNNLRTLKDTMETFRQDIPFQDLPQVLMDAVSLTDKLGFEYIWIDSLCIIQDDKDDWAREAARMSQVYMSAALTIIASRSTGASDSMFGQQEYHKSHDIPYKGVTIRVRPEQARDHADFNFLDREPFCLEPINKRSWTLQEALLSNRSVVLTMQEIRWQCNEWRKCECGVLSAPIDPFDWVDVRGFRLDAVFRSMTIQEAYQKWGDIVTVFTGRNLTYEEDRLPALSGLAQRFSEMLRACFKREDTYLAGIWSGALPQALLWSVERESVQQNRDREVFSKRPTSWRAPSWSWASIESGIENPPYIGMEIRAEVVDTFCKPTGEDGFGQVQSGYLKIRGAFLTDLVLARTPESNGVVRTLLKNDTPICGFVPDSQLLGEDDGDDVKTDLCALVIGYRKIARTYTILVLEATKNGTFRRAGVATQGTVQGNVMPADSIQRLASPGFPTQSTTPELLETAPIREVTIV